MGHGPAGVARGQHVSLGQLLDTTEVVVLGAHLVVQLGVGAARLLGRGDGTCGLA